MVAQWWCSVFSFLVFMLQSFACKRTFAHLAQRSDIMRHALLCDCTAYKYSSRQQYTYLFGQDNTGYIQNTTNRLLKCRNKDSCGCLGLWTTYCSCLVWSENGQRCDIYGECIASALRCWILPIYSVAAAAAAAAGVMASLSWEQFV